MKNSKTTMAILFLLFGMMPLAAYAESTTTQVNFNIETVVSYTLTLPGESGVSATLGGAPTTAIEFNSTTGTNANVEARVVGGIVQSSGTPIFVFDNTGNVDLNISVALNTATPACITLKGATTYAGTYNNISTSNTSVVSNFAPAAGSQDWYMQADFNACSATDTTSRTLTSIGLQS